MANEKRLIDANALKENKTVLWDEALGYSDCVLVEYIDNAPTVDAVEVVRCNDCKFYDEQDELADIAGWTDGEPYCFCEEMMEYMPRKGFCHKGEGKDNDR